MRARLLALLASFAFLFLGCGCAFSVAPRVVNYGRFYELDRGSRFSGSGFLWNGRYLITAAHALPDDRPSVVVPENFFSSRTIPGEVVVRESDIALVRLDVREDLPSLALAPRDLVPGEKVRILDGADGAGRTIEATAIFSDSLRVDGWLNSIQYGSSGSPVVNERDEVVGIVFGTIRSRGENIVSIYSAGEIRRALALHENFWPVAAGSLSQ